MFKCPVCGAVARTRTSRPLSEMTVRHYHQCQNFECSITFTTLNSVEKLVTKRAPRDKLPADFIPSDAFPASHYGNDQLTFAM
ncbi:ogr/Delta-like zinc finger family protein [Escherichia coli]|uniref:ogr/Delta-like zinc finger family protein n=1 Tax=Enterobacteriaceae TaxID=543 RepID=UPI000A3818D3|nr:MULTISPECIES: ogr/Delta-like zinc finger family protein [Enterobacteriaceae]EHU9573604.1 ogr/Delta-like zinc finger family protein [Salmonella enterica]DAI71956.1 MAG TPA: Ogr/Delta-like zinc finger protein [Caudoviricetes sp.]EGA5747107.1 ogr/Delta-like zinc finger family protein [Escherichia coli]EJB5576274.1 ogr/Delta-like zinc finger family protein [Citrobacter freundii]EKD2548032.1 ogr/Delta-like zinc finger family protein [Escherichia coli]